MMTKDKTSATDRVMALEQEVEKAFREVCRAVSGEHYGYGVSSLPSDLDRLNREAVSEANQVQGQAWREAQAKKDCDEVAKVAGEVASLRKRAGATGRSFRKKFEKVKGRLDGKVLSAAAIKIRGVLDCGHERLYRFVLHLLVTPGLLAQSRRAAASQHREDESLRSGGILAGQKEAGYWPRADAMLDDVEKLGRGFTVEQLQALKDLDIAEDAFEQLIAARSKHYEGKPWQEWPEVWSAAKQQERADKALEQFARAFLAAKAWEDLADKHSSAPHVRLVCRRHEQAVAQLTIARLEARVEALEAKLVGVAARPVKASPRTNQGKPKARTGSAK